MSKSNHETNLSEAPAISDVSRMKFEVFRLENEERQLTFIVSAHRKEAERVIKKGKQGLAHLHSSHREKLQEEVKQIRQDLSEMKNQLDDATDAAD
jgi:hypothetical protein